MMTGDTFTTSRILEVFADEIKHRQGQITDTFHDGRRLFVRSLLHYVADVRPKDEMQGGLALRATEDELWLHPYLFRQVCRNGAVMAQAIENLHVEYLGMYTLDEGATMLREAIGQCAEERVFSKSMQHVRSLAMTEVDQLLNLMPHLSYFQQAGMGQFLAEILARYSGARDRTLFGLMNATTSLARDTRNEDDRWRLEELGGGIGARLLPRQPVDGASRVHLEREYVPVA